MNINKLKLTVLFVAGLFFTANAQIFKSDNQEGEEEGFSFFSKAEGVVDPGENGEIGDADDQEPGLPINDYIPYLLAAGLVVAFANRKKLAKLNP